MKMGVFLGMKWGDDESEEKQMAQNLYGKKTQKEKDEQKERNDLLNSLGDKFESKHIFASTEQLRKIASETNIKNPSPVVDSKIEFDSQKPLQAQVSTTPELENLKQKYSHNIEAARNFEQQKMKTNLKQKDEKKIKESLAPKELPAYNDDLYGAEAKENLKKDEFEKGVNRWKKRLI